MGNVDVVISGPVTVLDPPHRSLSEARRHNDAVCRSIEFRGIALFRTPISIDGGKTGHVEEIGPSFGISRRTGNHFRC